MAKDRQVGKGKGRSKIRGGVSRGKSGEAIAGLLVAAAVVHEADAAQHSPRAHTQTDSPRAHAQTENATPPVADTPSSDRPDGLNGPGADEGAQQPAAEISSQLPGDAESITDIAQGLQSAGDWLPIPAEETQQLSIGDNADSIIQGDAVTNALDALAEDVGPPNDLADVSGMVQDAGSDAGGLANSLFDASNPFGADASAEPMLLAQASADAGAAAPATAGEADAAAAASAPVGFGPVLYAIGGLALAAAASGGGSSGAAPAPTSVTPAANKATGVVVDGPVRSATVFYDENNNGKLDAGEKSTTTAADGSYTLEGYSRTDIGKFVVLPGGVDIFSGKTVGYLAAHESADGSTVITPLTYLLATTNLTQTELKAALGLSGMTGNLEDFDPYAAMKSGDPATVALGEKVFTAGQQIMTILQSASQQKVSEAAGSTAFVAMGDVANAVAIAIRTVDNLPASTTAGHGLMDTIATFAIAAGNGVNVAAFENQAGALDSINAALVGHTTALSILGAVESVNSSIATAYTGLGAAITAGGAALADAQAVTALSQTLLMTSINTLVTTGVDAGLQTLSTDSGLSGLIDTVSNQITSGVTDTVIPQALEVTLAEALTHSGAYNAADAVVVNVADTELGSLVSNAGALHTANVDLVHALDGSLDLTGTQAASLVSAGVDFAVTDSISVHAEGTHLSTSLKDLQHLGADVVLVDGAAAAATPGHDIALDLGTGTLNPTGITHFAAADDVKLDITDTQVHEVAGLAADLHLAGIDHIGAADGTLDVGGADLQTIVTQGLDFAPEAQVTAQVSDAQLTDLVHDVDAAAAAHTHIGVDVIDMVDNTAGITETQAASLVTEGIHFAAADTVDMQAEGTHVSTTLKSLHDLGVDHVVADAATHSGHDLVLALGDVATGTSPGAELLAFLQTYDGQPATAGAQPAVFAAAADVALEVTQQVYTAVEAAIATHTTGANDIVTALVNLGVDEVKVIGTDTEHVLPDHHQ